MDHMVLSDQDFNYYLRRVINNISYELRVYER